MHEQYQYYLYYERSQLITQQEMVLERNYVRHMLCYSYGICESRSYSGI